MKPKSLTHKNLYDYTNVIKIPPTEEASYYPSENNSAKGLFDKVFDMTGEAFEKFGIFLRGESTEKKRTSWLSHNNNNSDKP
jgi:hypothetical protein